MEFPYSQSEEWSEICTLYILFLGSDWDEWSCVIKYDRHFTNASTGIQDLPLIRSVLMVVIHLQYYWLKWLICDCHMYYMDCHVPVGYHMLYLPSSKIYCYQGGLQTTLAIALKWLSVDYLNIHFESYVNL